MADEATMTAEQPQVEQAAPQAATIPDQPQENLGSLPQQNAGPSKFTRVLQTLAGNPIKDAGYDPNTGQQTGTPVDSKTGLIATILMHGLAGAFRGMAAPPGPGHVAQAGNLALQGGIQDQMRQREMMQQDFERQQQAQVQRMQIAHLNAQTALDSANAQHAGMESLNLGKQMNDEAVQQLSQSGAIETDANGNPVTMTQADILAKVQSGELNAGDSIGMQYGGTLVDGKPQAMFVINKDPNAPVKITQEQVDRWHSQGVDVPKEVVGQSIPAKSFTAYSNQALVHSTGTAVLNTLRHDAGTNKALLDKLPQNIDPNTPGMQTALRMLQQGLRGSKGDVYGALEAVYQKNPQAGQTLIDAMGGQDTIKDISNQHADDVKAAQAGAEETARENVSAPIRAQEQQQREADRREDRAFTASLHQQDIAANREVATATANNKDARDKVDGTVLKPYQEKMGNISDARSVMAQALDNPVAARAAVFKLIGVAQPSGSHRVLPAEIQAFRYPGNLPQRSVERFNDFLLGKPWTPEAAQAAQAFVSGQQQAAENNLRRGIANTNALYGTNIDAENILHAGSTAVTPKKPTGVPQGAIWNEGAQQWQLPPR